MYDYKEFDYSQLAGLRFDEGLTIFMKHIENEFKKLVEETKKDLKV